MEQFAFARVFRKPQLNTDTAFSYGDCPFYPDSLIDALRGVADPSNQDSEDMQQKCIETHRKQASEPQNDVG